MFSTAFRARWPKPSGRTRSPKRAGLLADAVIYLDVADDVARERLAGRAETGRADDADPAAIERRLQVFHADTRPLLDFYRERGILRTIDAMQSVEAVSNAILDALTAAPPRTAPR